MYFIEIEKMDKQLQIDLSEWAYSIGGIFGRDRLVEINSGD